MPDKTPSFSVSERLAVREMECALRLASTRYDLKWMINAFPIAVLPFWMCAAKYERPVFVILTAPYLLIAGCLLDASLSAQTRRRPLASKYLSVHGPSEWLNLA